MFTLKEHLRAQRRSCTRGASRADEAAALIERGSRERIAPVVTGTDGVVRLVAVRLDDKRTVSLELAEDTDALARSLWTMLKAELLPYENPSLLTGPTSTDVCAVAASFTGGPPPDSDDDPLHARRSWHR